MRRQTWYHAAQVVERNAIKQPTKWYDGDQRAALKEAKEDRDRLAEEFPGTEYTVLCVIVEEIGAAKIAVPVAKAAK